MVYLDPELVAYVNWREAAGWVNGVNRGVCDVCGHAPVLLHLRQASDERYCPLCLYRAWKRGRASEVSL